MIEIKNEQKKKMTRILIVGLGGAGNQTVKRMVENGMTDVDYLAINTDVRSLGACVGANMLQLGEKYTHGLGTGGDATIAKKAAMDETVAIENSLKGYDMAIITCGLGGGAGSGCAATVAECSKRLGILTVAVLTMPFLFEGKKRKNVAAQALADIKCNTDSCIVIDNNCLLNLTDRNTDINKALALSDSVIIDSVRILTDIVNTVQLINIDFADVCTTMKDKGSAYVGTGYAKGEGKALVAMDQAISNALLDKKIEGATNVIMNCSGDISMIEVTEAGEYLMKKIAPEAELIMGVDFVEDGSDSMRINIIATGM